MSLGLLRTTHDTRALLPPCVRTANGYKSVGFVIPHVSARHLPGSKTHRSPIVRADKLSSALAVPSTTVGYRHYFIAGLLVIIAPLVSISVFLIEQVRLLWGYARIHVAAITRTEYLQMRWYFCGGDGALASPGDRERLEAMNEPDDQPQASALRTLHL